MSVKLFMSYKSEDAVAVRMISELLRAQGLGVWFAEYNISVEDRNRFQELIDVAASECDYGICFTNDLYADSEFCSREVNILLQHLPPQSIIEIAFPRESKTHAHFPALASAKSLIVQIARSPNRSAILQIEDANRILHFIAESIGIPLAACDYEEPGYTKRLEDCRHGIRYSLDLAGWSQKKPDLLTKLSSWRSLGLMYERQAPDGSHMWGHVLAGPQDASIKRIAMGSGSDREYYEEALKFASFFYGSIHAQHCAGVHLLFSEGVSHPAFTTIKRDRLAIVTGQQVWMRLYSVVLAGRYRWNRDVEFAFFFFVKGNLQNFLQAAHIMDRLVLSFRRESEQCPHLLKKDTHDKSRPIAPQSPTIDCRRRLW